MPKQGYVAIFSPAGKMVAYSTDTKFVRQVASSMATTLPSTPASDPAAGITEARRVALRRIADGEGED